MMKTFPSLSFLFLYFLFLSCTSVLEKKESGKESEVKVVGAMKNVMWKGQLGPSILLDTLHPTKGLYGIGPESYLKGELLVLDGKTYVSRYETDSTMNVEIESELSAPFFVYSHVDEWKKVLTNRALKTYNDVEKFLLQSLTDPNQLFAFRLEGRIDSASIHLQNLPEGTKVSSPKEAHSGQLSYILKNKEVEILGFYSKKHQGIFTHHDAYVHMHLITEDRSMMGHLDRVSFQNIELYVPMNVDLKEDRSLAGVELKVLGTIQDAGFPHIACKKKCCENAFKKGNSEKKVVSLGLMNYDSQEKYLFEASPDMSTQLKELKFQTEDNELPNGIFLTHAHIGHYTGLMYLGKEATDANSVKVYSMPRMQEFLRENGPWSQLVDRKNIQLEQLLADSSVSLGEQLQVKAFKVPHRDEFSETVGFLIEGPSKSALFIPDIDKWQKWERSIIELIKTVDYAFLDATFYSGEEISQRDIAEIPHPFVIESMELFSALSASEKEKVYFIHLNHTNPLIDVQSKESKSVEAKGFHIARKGDSFIL